MTAPSTNTPSSLINSAMREAGLLQEGDEADSEQLALYMGRLNDLVNVLQTQGLKLWLQVDTSIPLVAGQQTYALLPGGDVDMTKPLRVLQGYYLDSSNVRRPIYPLSWDEWLRLSQVTSQGSISQFFVDKKQLSLSVSFWLIPDSTAATGTVHLLLQTQAANAVALTEAMNFPIEWKLPLLWGLAAEICTGQPQAVIDRCEAKALVYKTMLEDWDVEDTPTLFQPDQRMGSYGANRFV